MSLAQYEALLGRYHALVEHVVQMRREGFQDTPSVVPTVAMGPELPIVVRKAIASIAEPQSTTYRHLTKEALEMLALGTDATEVVQRIQEGEPAEL